MTAGAVAQYTVRGDQGSRVRGAYERALTDDRYIREKLNEVLGRVAAMGVRLG